MPTQLNTKRINRLHSMNVAASFVVDSINRSIIATNVRSLTSLASDSMSGSTISSIVGLMVGTIIITTGLIRQLVIG